MSRRLLWSSFFPANPQMLKLTPEKTLLISKLPYHTSLRMCKIFVIEKNEKRTLYKPFSKKTLEMLLPEKVAISEDSEEEISEEEYANSEEDDILEEEKSQK
ncbi:hypothetical protein AVEN_110879-1 [Araneus ventricosus]|uniref:Uncharacterized protein n=1 Tax=Araneus ventricosus TaxID=182803 RepID=A0A4Y2NLI1_ARAVE|nr:hypothetical protein AVEN_110879-1 [Araneus ventricosus]